MATLSVRTDQATAARIIEMAKLEDRSRAQITAAAVRWCVRLSSSARDALRRIEADGEPAVDVAAWPMGRALLDHEYGAVLDRGLQRYAPPTSADASEDEILAEAVGAARGR